LYKLEGLREVGLEPDTVNSILLYAGEEMLISSEFEDTASALFAVDKACMYSGTTDETVTSINSTRDGFTLIQRPTNNQGLVYDFLITNSMGEQNLSFDTSCGTAES
jgi:hypothetical protein